MIKTTKIYDEHYVEPKDVVTAPEHKKNLVYILVESYENTFADIDSVNYMPNLTRLAKDNLQFSDTEGLGGATVIPSPLAYTFGSIVAQTSGTTVINDYGKNITTLEDVLHDAGYTQVSILGSRSTF